ncbi:hypothetical protein ABZ656_38730 [Streptomyces sp. NPDC007095]|uniref:hypothetical protein n=1 Tax=Streptomyces sp. NPDC007095 TaxID=3154482 RepID=UPI0033FEEF1D
MEVHAGGCYAAGKRRAPSRATKHAGSSPRACAPVRTASPTPSSASSTETLPRKRELDGKQEDQRARAAACSADPSRPRQVLVCARGARTLHGCTAGTTVQPVGRRRRLRRTLGCGGAVGEPGPWGRPPV